MTELFIEVRFVCQSLITRESALTGSRSVAFIQRKDQCHQNRLAYERPTISDSTRNVHVDSQTDS